jgi:hypothetical protein
MLAYPTQYITIWKRLEPWLDTRTLFGQVAEPLAVCGIYLWVFPRHPLRRRGFTWWSGRCERNVVVKWARVGGPTAVDGALRVWAEGLLLLCWVHAVAGQKIMRKATWAYGYCRVNARVVGPRCAEWSGGAAGECSQLAGDAQRVPVDSRRAKAAWAAICLEMRRVVRWGCKAVNAAGAAGCPELRSNVFTPAGDETVVLMWSVVLCRTLWRIPVVCWVRHARV